MRCAAATSSSSRSRPLRFCAALAVAACFVPPPGWGEATLSAGVRQRVEYDSRPRLSVVETDPIYGYLLAPFAALSFEGQRWQVESDLELVFPLYDNDAFNIDEQRIDVAAGYAMPRSRFDLLAGYDRGSTLTSEVINDVAEVQASRREAIDLRPQWTRLLSARDQLTLGASVLDVSFDGRGFVDYALQGLDVTWQRALSETLAVRTSGRFSHFDSAPVLLLDPIFGQLESDRENDTWSLNLGLDKTFSPVLKGSLEAGYQYVETNVTTTPVLLPELAIDSSSDSAGGVFAAELDYDGELFGAQARISRALSPSVIGQLLVQDAASVELRRRLAPGLMVLLRGTVLSRDTVGDEPPPAGLQRDVLRIEPIVRWRFAERWTLRSGVRYATVDPQSVEGVRAFLEVRYDHPDTRVFR